MGVKKQIVSKTKTCFDICPLRNPRELFSLWVETTLNFIGGDLGRWHMSQFLI